MEEELKITPQLNDKLTVIAELFMTLRDEDLEYAVPKLLAIELKRRTLMNALLPVEPKEERREVTTNA